MEPLSLSQLLDGALGTPYFEAVNLRLLHNLLEAMLGLLVLPPKAHSTEEGEQETAKKDSLSGSMNSPQVTDVAADVGEMKMKSYESGISKHLLGDINGMKAEQSRMAEDIQMIKEALGLVNLQDAARQLPSLHEQKMLDDDMKNLKERLSLYRTLEEVSNKGGWEVKEDGLVGSEAGREGGRHDLPVEDSGGQFAPTEPHTSDMDTLCGASPALKLKGPATQPVPRTSKGTNKNTPGTQPGSLGTQGGMQKAPVTSEKEPEVPSCQRKSSDASATTPGMHPESPSIQTTTPEMHPASPGAQEGGAEVQPNPPYMEPSLPGSEKVPTEAAPSALGTQMGATSPREGGKASPSTQLAQAGHPEVRMLLPTAQGLEIPLDANVKDMATSQELAMPWESLGSSSAPDRCADTVEALHQTVQLGHLYTALKEQVDQLEATKLDHGKDEKLSLFFSEGDQKSITSVLADLWGQVPSWQGLASDLQAEKGKIRWLEDALGKLEVARADLKVDGCDQTTLQLESMLQEMKQELKELREQQEVTKATLQQALIKISDQQEQLDKLRVKGVESAGQGQAVCSICSGDVGMQVGLLLQHYEKLQEQVDSLMSWEPVDKVVRQLPRRSQDEELLKSIQATVVHLQGNCEKLSSVTGNLLDEHHEKQKAIKALSQSVERLEKEKADKEDLYLLQGIDEKADKTALAGKVSHTQFDASMERLNEMIQEMQSWVTGQEQQWHQLQQQLKEEMASKMDHVELGPLQQQLEEQWKSILEKKLKEKGPATEADEAAGVKKKLLAHFHCLSCDRPVDMKVPGPHVVSILSMPPLPSRPARNLHTVLEQEQTQQHSHREGVANGRYPSVPRQCGGKHTLSQAPLRCKRFQTFLPIIKSNEVELVGKDGHIYKGREYEELPVLMGKEGTDRAYLGRGSDGCEGDSREASPPQRGTFQPHPPTTSPGQQSSSCPIRLYRTDPAPQQLGGTEGP